MSKVIVTNETTGEGKVFDLDYQETEYKNFCRKAVLDWLYGEDCNCTISIGEDRYLRVNKNTPEPLRWYAACILYMQSVQSGVWGSVLDIYQLNDDDDEEEDE